MKRLKRGVAVFLSILMILTAYPVMTINATTIGITESGNYTPDGGTEIVNAVKVTYNAEDTSAYVDGNTIYYAQEENENVTGTVEIDSTYFTANGGSNKFNISIIYPGAEYSLVNNTGCGSWGTGENANKFNFSIQNGYSNYKIRVYNSTMMSTSARMFESQKTVVIDKPATITPTTNIEDGTTYYNTDRTLKLSFSDDIDVVVDKYVDLTCPSSVDSATEHNMELALYNGNEVTFSDEGTYRITARARDRFGDYIYLASNLDYTAEFTIDKTGPEISVKAKTTIGQRVLNTITFGLYTADVTATATVTDALSGVKTAQYKLVPEGTDASTVTYSDLPAGGIFSIPAEFKGFVYFNVEDNAGNVKEYKSNVDNGILTADNNDGDDTNDFTVGGVIVDTSVPGATGALNSPVNTVDDVLYYNVSSGTVTYTVTATEPNFIIESNKSDSVIEINKNGSLISSSSDYEWTATGNDNEYTTDVDTIITGDNDGRYQIKAIVKDLLTDTLANDESLDTEEALHVKILESKEFVIDTKAPEVEVTYNDVPSDDALYYNNTDQAVKVVVKDANFDPTNVVVVIAAKNAEGSSKSGIDTASLETALGTEANWTETSTGVWENTALTLSDDAHYEIELTVFDYAKNDYTFSDGICVDKTAPVTAVSYNGTDSASKDYYNNADQDITVTVTEENFNIDGVTATVVAKDVNGNPLADVDTDAIEAAIEDPTAWSVSSYGVWENVAATLAEDANYDITIDVTDLADNDATQFTDSICVDKTAPEITVSVATSIGKRVLQAITFGLYTADATATVTATDKISPITEITFEGVLQSGASSVNTAVALDSATDANGKLGTRSGYNTSAAFTIPAQFRGFVVATATDSATNQNTLYSDPDNTNAETIKAGSNNVNGILVDDIAPTVSVSFSDPYTIINNNDYSTEIPVAGYDYNNYATGDVLFYGAGSTVTFTATVTDANFDTKTAATGDVESDSTLKVFDRAGTDVTDIATVSGWTATGNPDEYQATVTISADGNDGQYYVELVAKDALAKASADGHTTTFESQYFIIDTYAPVVTDFDFQTSGAYYVKDTEDGSLDDQPEATKTDVMQYDYYFQEATTVTVNATDKKGGTDYVSGIRDVVLITCDYTSGSEVWSQVALTALDASAENADVSLSGTINGPFKGSIYAFVIDRLDQYPTTTDAAGVTVDQKIATLSAAGETFAESIGAKKDGFVSPNDSVIEDDAKHGETSSIGITLNTKTSNTEMSKDSYVGTGDFNAKINDRIGDAQQDSTMSTAKDVPLYNKNVSVTLDVKDEYSGIRQIDWYVLGRDGQDSGNNQSGTLTVDNEGAANGDDGWTAPKDGASNLVYSATKDITVSNNSNDIIVLVVLTDRAGNKSYDYTVLGIDKTAPVINVSYSDNNVRTGNYDSYYNHDRTVTVTVKERNFDAAKVVATIANTDSSYSYTPNIKNITSLSAWSSNGDANDPTYTYKITYTNDGTFKFDIKVTDRAGNSASKSEKAFTIDKTAPEITVSLSNSDVQRTKYFKADRTATITVKEHNFNAAEFENLIKATLNGSGITVPSISSWSRSGDNNTATVTFSAEGDYELSFKYEDMAGNKDATTDSDFSGVSPVRFTIDKTNPTLTISGVKDKTAYSTVPAISVSESDNNCYLITVILTGYTDPTSNEATEKFERTTDADHLRSLILELTAIADDGFYKISATGEDMAGNKSETSELTFTKNEHGSVLIPSSDLKELIGGYWNKDNVQDKSLYIDEYSLVPITESEYYININGKAQSAEYMNWVVVNDSPENGWYHYRYTIDESLITAEGEYTVYIRSTVHNNGDPEDVNITNNDADAEGGNRLEVSFNIDNTNPYIEIKGLEKHVNNRTTEKEVSLTVNESHLNYIYVVVREAGTTDETGVIEKHLWVNDTTDRNSYIGIIESLGLNEADVQVDSYVSETEDLPTATFTLDIDNAEKQDVEIRVADLAGNIASEDEDYNKPDIFTDISSSSREDNISSDANGIALKFISLSKTYAIGQMIKDNKGIAIGILIALLAIIAIAIIIPVAIKKRKALALEEAALDDDEDEEE